MRAGPSGSALTPLEVASGLVLGPDEHGPPVVPRPERGEARAALEAAMLQALRRPPCLVSFSGGLDSSAVLALASSVARREQLPLPVPVTLRFPGIEDADEASWQESVLAHVRVEDWVRVEIVDQLGVVGPVATAALREHGLLWPFNAYVHVPVFERARGGSVLTGFGGDEAFAPSRWDRLADVAARRVRPGGRDLRRLALALAPRSLRRAALRRRCPLRLPWLSAAGRAALAEAWAAEAAGEPRSRSDRGLWRLRLRALRTATASLGVLAAARDVVVAHPFLDPDAVAALARQPVLDGRARGRRLHAILGALLPAEVYARETKASFNAAFWTGDARDVAAGWGGEGVEPGLVVPAAVRAAWAADVPDGRTFTLLQSAWLSRHRETEATRAAGSSSR